jgi:ankyrin repeat protein
MPGNTALIAAVRGKHISAVDFLLKHNANPLLEADVGCSAIHIAQVPRRDVSFLLGKSTACVPDCSNSTFSSDCMLLQWISSI